MSEPGAQPAVDPRIHPSWREHLLGEFQSPYFADLKRFLLEERRAGKVLFPPGPRIFAAFDHTPWDKLKVVIIGQDPYHGPGQANGLCFSVNPGVPVPPSLLNMFKELEADLGIPRPAHGDLTRWADQGVLLLNATLTVEAHRPESHKGRGWERFTDAVIRTVSAGKDGVVFILWGRNARMKKGLIDLSRHAVLESAHPSPLSAHAGFLGSRPYSRANEELIRLGKEPIDWRLDP